MQQTQLSFLIGEVQLHNRDKWYHCDYAISKEIPNSSWSELKMRGGGEILYNTVLL